MASGSFAPAGFTFNIDGQYYTQGAFIGTAGKFLGDIDIDQIASVTLTSKFPQSDGTTYLPAFRVVTIDQKTYTEHVYYLTAYGLTLANLAAALLAIDSSSKFTTYPNLVSIDYNPDAILDYGSVLLNDRLSSNNRVYNQGANTTDIFLYIKRHIGPQVWTVTGNATFAGSAVYL